MKLLESDKKILIELRNQYISALKKRSENPADFATNIACIKEMRAIANAYQSLMAPFLKQFLKHKEKNKSCGFFTAMKYAYDVKQHSKLVKEASEILYSKEWRNVMTEEFSKESRIIALDCQEHETVNQTFDHGVYTKTVRQDNAYKIKFSDDTVLTLKSLTNEETLAAGKKIFDTKMEDLAKVNRITCGR